MAQNVFTTMVNCIRKEKIGMTKNLCLTKFSWNSSWHNVPRECSTCITKTASHSIFA